LALNSGGYQTIDDGGYQILLNYRSARNVARGVSFTQVLNGQIDPSWVKGKIVLIGATAPTAKDCSLPPTAPGKKLFLGWQGFWFTPRW
jgi:CHASE2 domain-containing sensor protein